jgi:hypothetical protein
MRQISIFLLKIKFFDTFSEMVLPYTFLTLEPLFKANLNEGDPLN